VAADGAWSVFLDIAGEPPGCLSEMPAVDSEIRTVEVVEAGSDESRVEVVLRESALNAVTGAGAILTGGRIENGRARLTVEVPLSSDTRGFVGRVQNRYPESTVVAIRERDRSVQTAREFRQSVDSRLTERQCEALRRAYAHGYFEWPRSNNASEVAASMTIAESTFHYHLRRALQKLLGSYLDADAGTEPIGSESRHG
jgi:predicted DNA binding protein